jgi:hypothetical protein
MSSVATIDELIVQNLKEMRMLLETAREDIKQPPSTALCKYLDALLAKADICKNIVRNLMELKKDMLAMESRIEALMKR